MLTRERIAEAEAILASKTTAQASLDHRVKPIRARLLPAGGAILDAILERYGADRIRVSDAGIREGTIFAVEHAPHSWRDQLPELAHGWRT
jgi:exopolyphosphatase/pppGpp-phosphohydrolase